jgi:AAA+ ATPase superfamily predicted ATPase
MLFSLKPKENLEEFFNYREELKFFINFLRDEEKRMLIIKGLRRTGKSSLLRVGLEEAKVKFVLIDTRELTALSRKSFEKRLLEELKSIKGIPTSLLERIESVEVGVRISLKKEENLWKLLKEMNPVIAIDEVQLLKGTGVDRFLAAVYDNTNCKIVLTGSEVGVLDSFLGECKLKAPLTGRLYDEIKLSFLTPEKARNFLKLGFKEARKAIGEEIIDKAISELDGVIGWLTMFGNLSLTFNPNTALKKTIAEGAKLAYSELESFLERRPAAKRRYIELCKILAEKSMGWSDLKRALQIQLKESISDPQFTNYLDSLLDYGFIVSVEGVYAIPDPLLKKALIGGVSNL